MASHAKLWTSRPVHMARCCPLMASTEQDDVFCFVHYETNWHISVCVEKVCIHRHLPDTTPHTLWWAVKTSSDLKQFLRINVGVHIIQVLSTESLSSVCQKEKQGLVSCGLWLYKWNWLELASEFLFTGFLNYNFTFLNNKITFLCKRAKKKVEQKVRRSFEKMLIVWILLQFVYRSGRGADDGK